MVAQFYVARLGSDISCVSTESIIISWSVSANRLKVTQMSIAKSDINDTDFGCCRESRGESYVELVVGEWMDEGLGCVGDLGGFSGMFAEAEKFAWILFSEESARSGRITQTLLPVIFRNKDSCGSHFDPVQRKRTCPCSPCFHALGAVRFAISQRRGASCTGPKRYGPRTSWSTTTTSSPKRSCRR